LIGFVVPAHNEGNLIRSCLASIIEAASDPSLAQESVRVFVVLDCCTDDTQTIAEAMGAQTLATDARNAGFARAAGAQAALDAGARWLAFTNGDSAVAPNWLSAQLNHREQGADAVCGTISVGDWADDGEEMGLHFGAMYLDVDVSAMAYQRAGCFPLLDSKEDVALVEALENAGATIAWSATPRFVTSARPDFRAPRGFGATLQRIHQEGQWGLPFIRQSHGDRDYAALGQQLASKGEVAWAL
jgi:glycosyltransferase involved in cell wall biosynthesis